MQGVVVVTRATRADPDVVACGVIGDEPVGQVRAVARVVAIQVRAVVGGRLQRLPGRAVLYRHRRPVMATACFPDMIILRLHGDQVGNARAFCEGVPIVAYRAERSLVGCDVRDDRVAVGKERGHDGALATLHVVRLTRID